MKRTRKYNLKRKRYSRKNGGGGKPLDKVINPNIPVGKNYQQLGRIFMSDKFRDYLFNLEIDEKIKEKLLLDYLTIINSVYKEKDVIFIDQPIYDKKFEIEKIGEKYYEFLFRKNTQLGNLEKEYDEITSEITSKKKKKYNTDDIFYFFSYFLAKEYINGFDIENVLNNLIKSSKKKKTHTPDFNPVSKGSVMSEEEQKRIEKGVEVFSVGNDEKTLLDKWNKYKNEKKSVLGRMFTKINP